MKVMYVTSILTDPETGECFTTLEPFEFDNAEFSKADLVEMVRENNFNTGLNEFFTPSGTREVHTN